MANNRSRWTRDWRGYLFGAVLGVVFALALAVSYYLMLTFLPQRLLYQARTHIFGWGLCQVLFAMTVWRSFETYPAIAATASLTGIVALAASFLFLSFAVQIGV